MSDQVVRSTTTPPYCQTCDAEQALTVRQQHTRPGYEHLALRLALCEWHALELVKKLLEAVIAGRRDAAPPAAGSAT